MAAASGLVEEAVERTRASILPRAAPRCERRRPAGPGVGYRPGPAEGCHEPQLAPVGQVDQRLEGGARFQQDAAQPVLIPSVLAGQEVPLGGQRPRRRNRRTWVSDRQERVGDAERRLRDDHRVSLVGLGVAGEEPGGPVRRESRQVRRRHPGRPGAGEREGAYVARLVDDHERIGEAAEQRVQVSLPVRDGGAQQHLDTFGQAAEQLAGTRRTQRHGHRFGAPDRRHDLAPKQIGNGFSLRRRNHLEKKFYAPKDTDKRRQKQLFQALCRNGRSKTRLKT
jgi:hypothetical protein